MYKVALVMVWLYQDYHTIRNRKIFNRGIFQSYDDAVNRVASMTGLDPEYIKEVRMVEEQVDDEIRRWQIYKVS